MPAPAHVPHALLPPPSATAAAHRAALLRSWSEDCSCSRTVDSRPEAARRCKQEYDIADVRAVFGKEAE